MWLSCTVYTTITLILYSSTVLYASGIESLPIWNQTWTDKLKQDLFVKYDKYARPTEHFNATVVKFGITPFYFDVNDFESTVTVTAWVRLSWTDEKLKWDPEKYGKVDELIIENHEVWQPDIRLYNSGTSGTVEYYGDVPCTLNNTGEVVCVPPAKFIALCELDFRLWPFDTQDCYMKFGSWAHHGDQIDFVLYSKEELNEEDMIVKNSEWKVINMSTTREVTKYDCCPEPYHSISLEMSLKRNSALYYNILLMPAAAIVFLVLVTFWLPPQSEMKISVVVCTILIIAVFLGFLGFKVPLTTTLPHIVSFYSGCLCLETMSLVISIMVINMSKRIYCIPLPRNIRLCLLSWPGKLLGLSDLISVIKSRGSMPSQELRGKLTEESITISTSNISDDGDRQNIISPTKDITQLEWILAGTAIDRIAFGLFCLILAIMAIVCISVPIQRRFALQLTMWFSCIIYTTITLILFSNTVLCTSGLESLPIWNQTWTDKLKQDLFVKYDKYARPTEHFNTTVVKFDINPYYINVNDFESTVTVTAWARLLWTDEKLKWDPEKYGNVDDIVVENHEIWQPDIMLYNSGTSGTVEYYGDAPCSVKNDGEILCVPPAKFIAHCELDFRLWPFDTQDCYLKFGSWMHHGGQIDLVLFTKEELDSNDMNVENAEWKLMNMTKIRKVTKYDCCPDPYHTISLEMSLKRNSALYYNILLLPAAAIVLLVLVTFWLPPQSEMKICVIACTILIIAVFLGFLGFKVPLTTTLPLIVSFYSGCLCLETISLVISIVVINMSKRIYCTPLPRNIRLCLLSWPGKLLGLSDLIRVIELQRPIPSQEICGKLTEESITISTSNISDDGDRQNIILPTKDITQLEWILAGTAIDRIAFVLFCLILAIMAIVCI
ncbi:uncharacterized protein LOC105201028 [Solenopsis invicta]|uniref:uncharacterized protein LOC105201028 n=1 Tax=Solenopsis invicta TaxID=13686 RepID=UPI00193D03DB|nr:uncharacterized protein LOC105201028 [Solenopsis invicta]